MTPPQIKGFGHVVIERVVGQALSANVDYEFPPEGVRWSIAMPLDSSCAGKATRRPRPEFRPEYPPQTIGKS